MWHFIAGISASTLSLYLSGQLYHLFGENHKSLGRRRAVQGIAALLVFSASLYIFQPYAIPIMGLVVFLISFLYEIKWSHRILSFLFLLLLAVGTEWAAVRLLMAGFGVTAAEFVALTEENQLIFWAGHIWAAFLALLLIRLPGLTQKRRSVFETRHLPVLSLAFPAASCLIVFAMANMVKEQNGVQTALFFLVYWLLFFANVFLVDLMERVTVSRIKEREQKLARLAWEQESARYQQILRQHSEIARLTHDIRNQLSVGVSLLREGRVEEACQLIEKTITAAGGSASGRITGNAAIDAILDAKQGQLDDLGITLFPNIVMEEPCAVSYEDLAVLTGSLMDNAITACAGCPVEQKRYIELTVRQIQDYLCVQMKHPTSVPEPAAQEGCTEDEHAAIHGFSVRSIRLVAEKYSGNMKLRQGNGDFTITVLLTNPMPMAKAVRTAGRPKTS